MASGKSFWVRQIAPLVGIPFVDIDEEIVKDQAKPIDQIFLDQGEFYFRNLETLKLKEIAQLSTPTLIACGGGISCRKENLDIMKASGKIIFLEARFETIVDRLLHMGVEDRPLLKTMMGPDFRQLLQQFFIERMQCFTVYDKKFEVEQLDTTTFVDYIQQHA